MRGLMQYVAGKRRRIAKGCSKVRFPERAAGLTGAAPEALAFARACMARGGALPASAPEGWATWFELSGGSLPADLVAGYGLPADATWPDLANLIMSRSQTPEDIAQEAEAQNEHEPEAVFLFAAYWLAVARSKVAIAAARHGITTAAGFTMMTMRRTASRAWRLVTDTLDEIQTERANMIAAAGAP